MTSNGPEQPGERDQPEFSERTEQPALSDHPVQPDQSALPDNPSQAASIPGMPAPAAPPAQQAQPTWAWASQPQPTQIVETEPLEYHRLLRGVQGYKWWKPLIMVLIAAVFYGVLTVILSLVLAPIIMVFDPSYVDDFLNGSAEIIDTQRPMSMVLSLASITLFIPAVILAMLVMGMRPSGRIWSVATRIRWGMLARFTGIAVLAVVVMNVVGIGLELLLSLFEPVSAVEPVTAVADGFDANAALLSLLFIVLLVPFQATAEEVLFRGLFMQTLGAWLKSKWLMVAVALVLPGWALFTWLGFGLDTLQSQAPTVLLIALLISVAAFALNRVTGSPLIVMAVPTFFFALGHIYDIWGLAAVSLMGLVAAWLTWRTGGLEAAIAIHIINNLMAFGFMAAGFGGETAQTEEAGGLGSLIGEVVGLSLFVWLVVRSFKKRGYGRTRIDLVRVPVAAPQAQPLP